MTSGSHGCNEMKRAAEIRKDDVSKRLEILGDATFFYHNSNSCCKDYTRSSTLKKIQEACNEENIEIDYTLNTTVHPHASHQTRNKSIPREPANCNKDPKYMKCVICGYVSHRKDTGLRADTLIGAAKYFQDEVFTRIAGLDTPQQLVAQDSSSGYICSSNMSEKLREDIPTSKIFRFATRN